MLFTVPFEHPTYQSVNMVHKYRGMFEIQKSIKHVLPLKHFDLYIVETWPNREWVETET